MPPLKTLSQISSAMMKTQLCHKYRQIDDDTGDENVEGKIVVVTGANGGIGKAVTAQLAKRGATVVMAARNLEKSLQVAEEIRKVSPNAQLVPVKMDLSSLDSVRAAAKEITEKFDHVNILVNCAGLLNTEGTILRNEAGHELHMATNHFGHFLLTLLLSKHLKKGAPSRVVCVGATAFQLAELNLEDLSMEVDQSMGERGFRPYSNSKLCNFLFARELGKRLKGQGVTTYCLCPGFINSELFDDVKGISGFFNRGFAKVFGGTIDQGSETVLYCALSQELANETSKPYHYRKYWEEADKQLDDEQAEKLFQVTEKIVGLKWSEAQ